MRRWPGRRRRRRAAIDIEQVVIAAVGIEMGRKDAAVGRACRCPRRRAAPPRRRRRRTARRCRGRSSRGCARRSRRRSPARCAPGPPCRKLSATASAIDEAGADRLHVEGGAAVSCRARPAPGSRSPERSRRASTVASTIRSTSLALDAGVLRAPPRRPRIARSEVSLAVGRDVALADAGALDDPLVGGVEALRQLGIGQDLAAADRRRSRRRCERARHQSAGRLHAAGAAGVVEAGEVLLDLLDGAVDRPCRWRRRSRWRSRTRRCRRGSSRRCR